MQAIIKKVCGELYTARVHRSGYTIICNFFQLYTIRSKKLKFVQKVAHSATLRKQGLWNDLNVVFAKT